MLECPKHYFCLSVQVDWQEVNTEIAEPLLRAGSGHALPQRGVSDASALISHFDDWANVLDSHEAESSLSRRGSGKLEGLEPDALRSTVDGLLKRQPAPSKLQPHAPTPAVLCTVTSSTIVCCGPCQQAATACTKPCSRTYCCIFLTPVDTNGPCHTATIGGWCSTSRPGRQ